MEHDSEESDQSGTGSGDSSEGSESDEASGKFSFVISFDYLNMSDFDVPLFLHQQIELDEEYVRRRQSCLEQMSELEKQYIELYDM